MNFYVATLFPEQVTSYLNTSITGRGMAKGAFSLECIQMRDFAPNNYGRVDDTIYGGGTGMMIRPEPVFGAYEKAVELCGGKKPHTVYMSPKGSVFNQAKAHELAKYDNLLIICGHVVIDAVARLIPGVLPNEEAYTNESHTAGVLEAPQYTKPPVWHDKAVPEILKTGNDAAIAEYNRIAALVDTWHKRPDMLDKLDISESDWAKMLAFERGMC